MATQKEIKQFAMVKNGYTKIEQPDKPIHGNLLIDNIIKEFDKPFALLQYKKKRLVESGVSPKRIKISYV